MNTILSLGFILLVGLLFAKIIGKFKFPSVTAYLVIGIIIGPSIFNVISKNVTGMSGFISTVALSIIAFSIGQNFSRENFRQIGKTILWISILEACGAWLIVTFVFLVILHQPFYIAILFGAISSATAPAATLMVIREYKAKGVFTNTLLGVVAIDDAWCLLIFSVSLAISKAIHANLVAPSFLMQAFFASILGISGSFLLGGITAWCLSYLSRYIHTPAELLTYTLGFILLNSGIASAFNLSVLLANMVMGALLVNINKEPSKFFDSLHSVDSPIYLVFFVLAGASLEVNLLLKLGIMGICYVIFRVAGKMLGAYAGGKISGAPMAVRRYLGLGLVPQAGVALGAALVAKTDFPAVGGIIITTIVATTVVYELFGPFCTKIALEKAGDIEIGK